MGIIIVLKSWFCFNGQKSKKEICSVFTVVVYYSVSTHTTIYMSISLHCRQNLTQDYGCVCISCSVMTDSLRPHGVHPSRLLCPWNSPGKNTGVGCHSLLQGISLTQGWNLGLLHCLQLLYHLSHQGSRLFQIRSAGLTWEAHMGPGT